jgi:hypothetical protein
MSRWSILERLFDDRTEVEGIAACYGDKREKCSAAMEALERTLKGYSRTRTLRFIQRYAGVIVVCGVRLPRYGQPLFGNVIVFNSAQYREPHEIIFLLFRQSFVHRWRKYRRGLFSCWWCAKRRLGGAIERQAERFVALDFPGLEREASERRSA